MEIEQDKKFSYLDEFKILKTLGAGYHAQVKLGVDPNGNYVAIKRYKKETANLKTLQHELEIMKQLNHQNLVKLIDVRQNATYKSKRQTSYQCFAIIIEYVGGGQLFDYVADTGKFSQKVARTYFHQMMNGLHYMHSKGYAHRDIKPQNILLSQQFILKLADFGFSCLLKGKDGSGILHTKLGTEGYMAPEIQEKKYDGTKTDIFAAGVILFIMYAGNPPFQKASANDPYFKLIREKNYNVFWSAHSRRRPVNYFTQKFRDLIQKMIAYEPDQRITIDEISKHPWVNQSISTYNQIKQQFTKRQVLLDKIVNQRRQQQQEKKNQRYQGMKNHGAKSRGQGDVDIDKDFFTFFQIYVNQSSKQRKLNVLEPYSKQDFIVKEELSYIVSNLKQFFTNGKILLQEISEDELIDENEIPALKVSEVKDQSSDKITLVYSYNYGNQDKQIKQTIELTLTLGQGTKPGNIVIHFDRQSGNQLYYKKIVRQIKNKFAYCLVKQQN